MSVEHLTPDSIGQPQTAPGQPQVEKVDRSQFLSRTYGHLLGAIFLFTGLEYYYFQTPWAEQLALFMLQTSWLAVLGAFIVVSWIASSIAHRVESKGAQYAALGAFVVAESLIFIPMFYIALAVDPKIIEYAVAVTLGAFVVLTAVVMITGRDFSFLKGFLLWAGVIALGTIGLGLAMGFHLGTYFSMAMIGLAGASILYDTSKIMKSYPDDRYVAAALELFASIAMMLWYVIRLFLSRR